MWHGVHLKIWTVQYENLDKFSSCQKIGKSDHKELKYNLDILDFVEKINYEGFEVWRNVHWRN